CRRRSRFHDAGSPFRATPERSTCRAMRLYDFLPSGNGYKVRLLLSRLRIPFTLVEKRIFDGETRTPEFLALNPNGRIPLLELDDGRRLAESDAILFYLGGGSHIPSPANFERAT